MDRKRLIALGLTVALVVIFVFTSCAPAAPAESTAGTGSRDVLEFQNYSLIQENDRFFISSKLGSLDDTQDDGILYIMLQAEYPEFPSIAEMKRAVENGELTESEVYALTRNSRENPAVSEICNLNGLFEAVYPDNLTLERIDLTGNSYRFVFQENYGYLWCMEKSSYDNYYKNYTDPVGARTLLSEETVKDRDAVVTCSEDAAKGEVVRTVRYELPVSDGTVYVMESYKTDTTQNDGAEKLERLEIFGNAHGQYFYMFLMELAERPTVEWLTSVGLREFAEEDMQ